MLQNSVLFTSKEDIKRKCSCLPGKLCLGIALNNKNRLHMAHKILRKLEYSVATHFRANDSTVLNHFSLRMSSGSNISFNYACAIKGWLRMSFFIQLLNKIILTLNQLTINNRSKSIEKQILGANKCCKND